MFCMVRWVAGCERTLTSGVPGKQKAKSQTEGGVNEGEGGGGGEGLSPCFLISIRENIFETLSSNGLLEEQKTHPFPCPFKFCWCLLFPKPSSRLRY